MNYSEQFNSLRHIWSQPTQTPGSQFCTFGVIACVFCLNWAQSICFFFSSFFFPVMVGVDFFAWISSEHWQTASQMLNSERCARQCDRLHRESVARLTGNIPVKSDICFQSSPPGSLLQLPWKPQCHFPPLFGLLDILKAFSDSWFIKACIHHQWMGACFVQFLGVCTDYRYSVCTCAYMHVLRLTFTADIDVHWGYAAAWTDVEMLKNILFLNKKIL